MARVDLANSSKEILADYGPDDQQLVARAVSLLEDDDVRERSKDDLSLLEDGYPIFSFQLGSVWIEFTEVDDVVTVVHLSVRSRFRYG